MKAKLTIKKAPAAHVAATQAEHARWLAVAAALPTERTELMAAALDVLRAYDGAVMASEKAGAEVLREQYRAAVWKLNGETFFASEADKNAPGNVLAELARAEGGRMPLWGQRGEMLLEVDGVRALVSIDAGMTWRGLHLEFHAVDLFRPFLSETGYRSHFSAPMLGRTTEEAARIHMAELIRDTRRMVEPKYRDGCEARAKATRWLPAPTDAEAFEDQGGQFAFAF